MLEAIRKAIAWHDGSMPRKTKPLTGWRGNRWAPPFLDAIDKRLARRAREKLVAITGLTEGSEIDALLTDIEHTLVVAWAYRRDVDGAAFGGQLYHTLKAVREDPEYHAARYFDIDATTRAVIEEHYPDGHLALAATAPGPEKLKVACEAALAAMPKPKRGRPPASRYTCLDQLARGLAEAYHTHVDRPTRCWDDLKEIQYGPYFEFVLVIVSLIPRRLMQRPDGAYRGAEAIARRGIELLNKV